MLSSALVLYESSVYQPSKYQVLPLYCFVGSYCAPSVVNGAVSLTVLLI